MFYFLQERILVLVGTRRDPIHAMGEREAASETCGRGGDT